MKLYAGKVTLTFDCSDIDQRAELKSIGNHNEKDTFIHEFQQYLRSIYKYESQLDTFTEVEYALIDRIYSRWFEMKDVEGVEDE